MGEVCTTAGYSLMIVPPLEGSVRRAVVNAAADGFLTLGLELSKPTMLVLQQRGVPFVMVDSEPIESICAVNVDDEAGAYQAMQHVLSFGHKEVLILGLRSGKEGRFQEYAGTLRHRMDGYQAALDEVGLALDGKQVRLTELANTLKAGESAFAKVWQSAWRPTAIVAMSDILAIGAMKAARESGLDIPKDLSVIGFDGIPQGTLVCPALSTVEQPIRAKGKLAADLLLSHMEEKAQTEHHVLPIKLTVRDSVAPPSKKIDL
jgi:alanine racemase